jgi:hypothetical protein
VRHAPAAPLENRVRLPEEAGVEFISFFLLLTRRVSAAKSQGQAADEEGAGCHESSGQLNEEIEKGIVNSEKKYVSDVALNYDLHIELWPMY